MKAADTRTNNRETNSIRSGLANRRNAIRNAAHTAIGQVRTNAQNVTNIPRGTATPGDGLNSN